MSKPEAWGVTVSYYTVLHLQYNSTVILQSSAGISPKTRKCLRYFHVSFCNINQTSNTTLIVILYPERGSCDVNKWLNGTPEDSLRR